MFADCVINLKFYKLQIGIVGAGAFDGPLRQNSTKHTDIHVFEVL